MQRLQGVAIILLFLIFYMLVGTPEYALMQKESSIKVQAYDYALEIEKIEEQLHSIYADMESFSTEIEELQPDPDIPLNLELQLHLKNKCNEYGVDLQEAIAIMLTENPQLDPQLIHKNENDTSDYGLFQINQVNHKWLSEELGITDFLDPKQNITAAIYFISKLDKYSGHEKYMAYNMGEGGMKKAVSIGITNTDYSRKVMRRLEGEGAVNEKCENQ